MNCCAARKALTPTTRSAGTSLPVAPAWLAERLQKDLGSGRRPVRFRR